MHPVTGISAELQGAYLVHSYYSHPLPSFTGSSSTEAWGRLVNNITLASTKITIKRAAITNKTDPCNQYIYDLDSFQQIRSPTAIVEIATFKSACN